MIFGAFVAIVFNQILIKTLYLQRVIQRRAQFWERAKDTGGYHKFHA